MVRRYRKTASGKIVLDDIICDRCGQSTKTLNGFEKATISANFEEGFHAGDRFLLELCQRCFDAIMINVLVDNKGTCIYHSEILGDALEAEDLREMYAYLRSGTLIYNEDDIVDDEDEN